MSGHIPIRNLHSLGGRQSPFIHLLLTSPYLYLLISYWSHFAYSHGHKILLFLPFRSFHPRHAPSPAIIITPNRPHPLFRPLAMFNRLPSAWNGDRPDYQTFSRQLADTLSPRQGKADRCNNLDSTSNQIRK